MHCDQRETLRVFTELIGGLVGIDPYADIVTGGQLILLGKPGRERDNDLSGGYFRLGCLALGLGH